MALVLAACGSSATNSAPSPSAPTPAPQAPTTTAPAGGELVIGALLAMTGGGSWYGEVMSAGAELAVNELNAEGGVEGWTFKLVIEDHESGNADAAVAGARKLMDIDRASVILGSFTAPTVAAQALTSESGVLLLNGGGIGNALIGQAGLYNTRMLGAQLMPGLLEWAVETYSAQRIAVIHWNDAAGRAIKESVDAYCATAGCEVVVSEPHEVDERNYSPMLARISASNADMLVIGSWGNDVGYILDQARRQGLQIPAIGNEWTPDAQEIGGAAMEEYVAILDNFDADNPANDASARFISAHRTTYGEDPEFYGANYYELVKMVIPELVRLAVAQGLDPSERGVLMDVMAAAVAAGTPFESLYGGSMTFNDNGTIQKPAGAYRVSGGTLGRFGLLQAGSIVEG